MKLKQTLLAGIMIIILSGCAIPLSMGPPPLLTISGIKQHPHKAGLYVPKEVQEYVYIKQTSPVDKMTYPIGKQTHEFFKKNMPLAFRNVVEVDSIEAGQDVDIFIQPSIVKFDSVIPMPAYKPYTAKIVYRVDVYNKKGERIFAQTTTGSAQSSKGIMSGFFARGICSDVAQMAMKDALIQVVEGIADAEELENL